MPQPNQGKVSRDILSGITITISIFAVSIYMPLLGLFCALFLPLPVLFYRSKLGRKNGGIVPAVTITAVVVVTGSLSFEAVFFAGLIILGFVLAELIEMNLTVEITIGFAAGSVLLIGMLALFFYSIGSQTGIYKLVSDYVLMNLEFSLAMYERMGMSDENVRLIAGSLKDIQYAIVRIIPGLAVASILFVSWMNLLMARLILIRKSLFFPGYGALNRWRSPDFLVWGVIGSGGLLLTGAKSFKMLGLNGLIILLTIYFFAGIAVVSFFFDKKRLPPMLRFFLYSLIALQQLFLLFVIGLGLFDTWLNFRKIETGRSISEDS
ncbi:MAG: DUF2232 domain-containing protein [Desulfobacterales bacterium]|nr:DUF2232 domain-containing protein [Desulfobacterales bacterium]